MSPKNRQAPRYPIEIPMVLHGLDRQIEAVTADVSAGGVYASSPIDLPAGELVRVDLELPPDGRVLSLLATLVHATHRQRSGAGLRFHDKPLDDAAAKEGGANQLAALETWRAFVKNFEEAFPKLSGRASAVPESKDQAIPMGEEVEPVRKRDDLHAATLRVRFTTVRALRLLCDRGTSEAGSFVLCDKELDAGTKVGLQLIHPVSEDVFEGTATVTRRVVHEGLTGLGIRIVLEEERQSLLDDFVYDGMAGFFDEIDLGGAAATDPG